MTINLRELAESDLATTLEGDFGLPVELTGPDGAQQNIFGQVVYDTIQLEPETGMPVVDKNPVVTLRIASLDPVPQDGEIWYVRIPGTPSPTAPLVSYTFDGTKPSGGGASIGFIKLPLHLAEQA